MSFSTRNNHGTMGLVAISGFVLVLIVLAAFGLLMRFGGAKETANAVDAGALNVGKRCFEQKVSAQSADEEQFKDVADSQNKFGLTNINRVWAKAMLAAANVSAMSPATPQAQDHANRLFQAAKAISDRLADKLNTPSNLHQYFSEISHQNSVRMVGTSSTAEVENVNWETSLTNRGIETNIEVTADQFPTGTFGNVQAVNKTIQGTPHSFIPGYKPINYLGNDFCFVPFKAEEKTHLISLDQFENDKLSKKALPQWSNPVPNSFSCQGKTSQASQYTAGSISCVLANPQRPFKLQMPGAYIKIKLKEKSTATWYFNGIPWPATTSYDYVIPENSTRGPGVAGLGTITGTCTFGLEYINKTVYGALFALPTEDYSDIQQALVQRIREIAPGFTTADLEPLLSFPLLPAAADHDTDSDNTVYIVFKDGNGQLKCLPQPEAQAFALNTANFEKGSDGPEFDHNESPMVVPGIPGVAWGTPVGFGTPKDLPDVLNIEGHLYWTPGSGFDGCLGELRLERGTDAFINGIVTFP